MALARIKSFVYNKATMKKKLLVLSLIPIAFSSLIGCSSKKDVLTFGTYINQAITSLDVLSNEELLTKANNNETFLLAVYQGSYSEDCLCWSTFQNIIASYMNKYNERVYVYNAQGKDDTISHLKIDKYEESAPSLYVFSGNKQLAKFSEKNSKDKSIFGDTTCQAMYQRVHKVINKPKIYYVDDAFLKENLGKTSKAIVSFVRKGCGDCSYVLPNVIIPYIKQKNTKNDLWLFDMQDVYDISKCETASEEEKGQYQALKDYYGLSVSGNATFGYQEGVVPTTHYYENGVLKDASVYFNDSVSIKEDGSYYVSDSYYSSERLINLTYLKDVKFTTILKDMTVQNNNVLFTKNGNPYWSQEDAAKYHTPILKAFLDYYA